LMYSGPDVRCTLETQRTRQLAAFPLRRIGPTLVL